MILLNPANVLMVLTVCLTLFMPATGTIKNPPTAFLVVLGLSELLFLVRYAQTKRKSVLDVAVITFALFAVWEFTVKAGLAHPVLVPSPEDVFYVFVDERQLMLRSIGSSL